jgi:uncharacterized surface protein with fasciclin (FAS1) repeats
VRFRSQFSIAATVALLATTGLVACGDEEEDTAGAAQETTTEQTQPMEESMDEGMAGDQDIVALAQDTPDLSTLVEAVTAADLAETLQGDGPFTVFAPTNDAFDALGGTLDELLQPENQEQLQSVLTYHVVPTEAMAADLEDGQMLETVNGEMLEVSIDGDTVMVGDATVVMPDVDASNGVVHVIDTVLVPGS